MPQTTTLSMLPSEADAALAKETGRVLASRLGGDNLVRLQVMGGGSRASVKLPAAAARLLVRILDEMARGNAVTLIPVHAELTTQEAADMLGISRPSLIRLLDEGKVEYRRVGTHRRVRFDALMKHKRQADAARRAALAELAAYDQELGI
jgi:excisionase family DNA binding protein